MNPLLSTADLCNLVPSLRAKVFVADLTVMGKMKILGVPSRLVIFVPASPNPEICHPGLDILGLDSVGYLEPPVREEMADILGGKMLVWNFWGVGREVFIWLTARSPGYSVLCHSGIRRIVSCIKILLFYSELRVAKDFVQYIRQNCSDFLGVMHTERLHLQ